MNGRLLEGAGAGTAAPAGAARSAPAEAAKAAAMPAVRFLDCARVAPQPWANGAGVTRLLARGPAEDDTAGWRVSLATLDGAAQFSQFPGYDRTLLLVDDGVVDLHSQDGQLVARPGQPVHFPGDLHVWVNLPARPMSVLNVMCRRGAYRARVTVAAHSLRVTPAPTHLLVCTSGEWHVESALLRGVVLPPLQGLWLGARPEELALRPAGPGAQLVSIAIEPVVSAAEAPGA